MSSSHGMRISNQSSEPDCFEIGNEDVHLWYGKDPDMHDYLRRVAYVLSQKELVRSGRYHFPMDRNRYLFRHGVLRMIIGRYLAIDPKEIRFGVNRYGKLFVENTDPKEQFEFNISHSNEMVLFAFTLGRRIGVDIEYIRPIKDMNSIVKNNFSPDEKLEFDSLPANKRLEAFYHCWTQKEAFLKALGEGLSRDLDQFDVSVTPEAPAALKRTVWDQEEAGRWSLAAIHPFPGYAAALAVEGSGWVLQCRKLIL